jgi:hypothetical protein
MQIRFNHGRGIIDTAEEAVSDATQAVSAAAIFA